MDLGPVFGTQRLRDRDLFIELSAIATHPYHKVPTLFFRISAEPFFAEAGQINLRTGSTPHIQPYAGHLGYEVCEAFREHRYGARCLRLLLPLAHRIGIDPLRVTCDPENTSWRRSLELAGAQFVETVEVPTDCWVFLNGHRQKCRCRL
jgi:predicted acetyltransferase